MFWAAFTFMVVGLLRLLVLAVWEIIRAVRRAGDKDLPYRQVATNTAKWLIPFSRLRDRFVLRRAVRRQERSPYGALMEPGTRYELRHPGRAHRLGLSLGVFAERRSSVLRWTRSLDS